MCMRPELFCVWQALILSLLISACSAPDTTGPGQVRWDQETCARCSMAIGDRYYAAQVRGAPAGEQTRLYKFDDIGCALIWLDQQPWKNETRTEIWVPDYRSGEWLDARQAFYVTGRISPMNYGLGAIAEATADTLDFTQARAHILDIEESRGDQHHHHHAGAGQ